MKGAETQQRWHTTVVSTAMTTAVDSIKKNNGMNREIRPLQWLQWFSNRSPYPPILST
jgi:hypothetical protein